MASITIANDTKIHEVGPESPEGRFMGPRETVIFDVHDTGEFEDGAPVRTVTVTRRNFEASHVSITRFRAVGISDVLHVVESLI